MKPITRPLTVAAALTATLAFLGCAIPPAIAETPDVAADAAQPRAEAPIVASGWGVVTAIEPAGRRGSASPGTGAVVGGALGAMIGRQIGSSVEARNAGTVIGAALGALAGHHIEKEVIGSRDGVRITVQLDRGGTVAITQRDAADLRIGERVRVENNRIVRMARAPADLQSEHT